MSNNQFLILTDSVWSYTVSATVEFTSSEALDALTIEKSCMPVKLFQQHLCLL